MDYLIRDVRLRGGDRRVDVAVEGERIAAVEPHIQGSAEREIEGGGALLVPGFVNAHMHIDKSMLGDVMRPNESQTLQEAIEITLDHRRRYTVDEIVERASRVVEPAIANGTTAMRLFSDVGTVGGLMAVQGLLELKRLYDGQITLDVVAFPQEGIVRDPGTDSLLEQAMELGADVVGGLPWYERTDEEMRQHIDFCLELAQRMDKDVHMLVDDTDDPFSRSLEYLAIRTKDDGYDGRVCASHCGALGAYDDTHAEKVIGLVRDAGITIVSNSHISLVMAGRNDRGRVRRGITRVRELLAAGVNVASAQDDVNDPYYPFGKPDQLEVAQYMAHVAHLTYPTELETVFDMVTTNGARAMRLEGYGIEPGRYADLVLIDAPTVREALRLQPPRRCVWHRGRLVAETRVETTRHDVPAHVSAS